MEQEKEYELGDDLLKDAAGGTPGVCGNSRKAKWVCNICKAKSTSNGKPDIKGCLNGKTHVWGRLK